MYPAKPGESYTRRQVRKFSLFLQTIFLYTRTQITKIPLTLCLKIEQYLFGVLADNLFVYILPPTAVIQGIGQSHKLGLVVSSTASATKYSPVAQLVEHLTVNQVVGGSIPPWGAKLVRHIRLTVRTPGFHPGNKGSVPLCDSS